MRSFEELEAAVVEAARSGEIHLYMDFKPEFPDTPRNWEQVWKLLSLAPRPCAVTESIKTRVRSICAPYARQVGLNDVAYPSGMRLLRAIREGSRLRSWRSTQRRRASAQTPVRRHARLGRFQRDGMTYRLPGEAG